MKVTFSRASLESLYLKYNHKSFIHPDPLEFVHRYREPGDREVVALIAACLAYGRVAQILASVSRVLEPMSPSPARFLEKCTRENLEGIYGGFKHRFTTGSELASFLGRMGEVLRQFGSMEACFLDGYRAEDASVVPALSSFARQLTEGCGNGGGGMFLPSPQKGSACKRLHLFLRWMVRNDDVDPGVWKGVDASQLIIPLDTHMFRIARFFQLTTRNQANHRTAVEITESFRTICREDPVRYDFALTRLGIREGVDIRTVL
jgi:uncharacterized protein (TIGR02757 family)